MSLQRRAEPHGPHAGKPGALSAPGFFCAPPPLTLYIHLPWCERKCPYCDFNSYELRTPLADLAYVDALLRDLDLELACLGPVAPRPLIGIFIGGGTPSLFSGEAITRLLTGIRARAPVATAAEITLEANPGTVEADRFRDYAAAGVTRLSIGVQSFRDAWLRRLGRIHSAGDALRAVGIARAAGFTDVNIDLMYGLPDDDATGALDDLKTALSLETTHLSWYQLTLEPGTAFHRRPPALPDDDRIAAIELEGRALIAQHDLVRYEISAYARGAALSIHNLNYWRFGDYIGIGAGAHGKLSGNGSIVRRSKKRNPHSYIESAGQPHSTISESIDDADQLVVEFMMNALRLVDGVDTRLFEAHTGLSPTMLAAGRAEAEQRGWLDRDPEILRATPAGLELLNRVVALF